MLVHEAGGFRLSIPAQGPTGKVGDIYVPGDPAFVGVVDDFRRFYLIAMDGELGDLSAEEWVAARTLSPETTEAGGSIETEYGDASIVRLLDSDITAAVLPVDGRIFYFAYMPQTWMGDERHVFASGYGLKLEPAEDVLAEFVEGLSLLED